MLARYLALIAIPVASALFLVQHQDDELKPHLPKDSLPEQMDLEYIPPGFSEPPPAPDHNPTTAEKVRLGRTLFFDPILSGNGTVSCASCHLPDKAFATSEALAIGINGQQTTRNSPTLFNRAYGEHFFWDGRSESLEKQALDPITNPAELGADLDIVLSAIRSSKKYQKLFADAFGGDDPVDPTTLVTSENLGKAIASFERTLLSGNSGVDRFRRSEYTALSREARQGMWIFESRGGCWKCHSGPNFTDEEFHNTGVSFGTPDRDTGRMQFTEDENDRHKFKTPTLRDVELTAPYMHDGSMKTLREVVEFYNKGGAPDDPQIDDKLKPLDLSEEEIGFLVEFLKALTGERSGIPE